MSGSLAESLLDTPSGSRIIALEVERGYRDAKEEELTVAFARYVRCSHCMRKGCPRCDYVGWNVHQAAAKVLVPRGATPGTRVTVEGAGDDLGSGGRPLVVEIVQAGPRADELRAAQADFEGKLETAWGMEKAARGGHRRRRGILASAMVLLLLLVPVGRWLAKPGAGEPCTKGNDCRSGHCIGLRSGPTWEPKTSARLDALTCTDSCTTDLDCPESMRCRGPRPSELEGNRERTTQFVVDMPDGLSCVPRGY